MNSVCQIRIFGIRHHGPGCARSLLSALEAMQPDCILIEGPPDAERMIPLAAHPDMEPPVALLVYVPNELRRAAFYPFAIFSPEWQTLQFALRRSIPLRFMDLPQAHQFALDAEEEARLQADDSEEGDEEGDEAQDTDAPEDGAAELEDVEAPEQEIEIEEDDAVERGVRADPIGWLARAAGYSDGERWWEHMIEQRLPDGEIFEAIGEAMTALRAEAGPLIEAYDQRREELREAWMRRTLRAALKEGFERIAVVCGAWHVPALTKLPPAKHDNELLKKLPKVKTESTWTAWTYGRIARDSGYGAGVVSPGWYDHLWQMHGETNGHSGLAERWLVRVARLLRDEEIDISSAHVIEAVRMADSLAAIGDLPRPGLPEFNEAIRAIFFMGDDRPMQLIHRQLIVGERLGRVSDQVPVMPLVRDLEQQQKSLRLKPEALERKLDLDLRKEIDLSRSRLLHRLAMLSVPWGEPISEGRRARGTFHEYWQIQWKPELAIALIEAAIWGQTVEQAAANDAVDRAEKAEELAVLARLIDAVILADLADAIGPVMRRLEEQSAVSSDVVQLMDALPPLAGVIRYGDVRGTQSRLIERVLGGIAERVCIGLGGACDSLDDDAARAMFDRIAAVHDALNTLREDVWLDDWLAALVGLLEREDVHGLICGRACRLLLEAGRFDSDEAARRLGLALSPGAAALDAAAWLDGFLSGGGLILLHDDRLWSIVDDWVCELGPDRFIELLPLMRRTFAGFAFSERRELGEKVRAGRRTPAAAAAIASPTVDDERAASVLPLVARMLGLD